MPTNAIHRHPQKAILVIGATGGVGGAVAARFLAQGWRVRALTRQQPPGLPRHPDLAGIEWLAGDAMNEADVCRAAMVDAHTPVDCLFHGANPPRYQNWQALAIPMLSNAMAAARQSGARLIFPGNVYNFGPDAGTWLAEDAPQHPLTRKGRVRVEMEQMLQRACEENLRAIVVRAGDFFGRASPSSWFSTLMIQPGRPVRKLVMPMEPGVGHAWAYLPDLADTIYRLAELQATLPAWDTYHFGGHWVPRSEDLIEAIRRATGQHDLPVRRAPWWAMKLLSPLVPLMREILEMRYLWQEPIRLDNRKLVKLLGSEPHTPLDAAIRQALLDMGCLAVPR